MLTAASPLGRGMPETDNKSNSFMLSLSALNKNNYKYKEATNDKNKMQDRRHPATF